MKRLLEGGYFPSELPPPFSTGKLAKFRSVIGKSWRVISDKDNREIPATNCSVFNTPRKGHDRRLIKVPNPIAYFYLCESISENWNNIFDVMKVSPLSVSKDNIKKGKGRAMPMPRFAEIPEHRIKAYAARKFILQTDLSRFYHSIYTHSVPWAFHTKAVAKKNTQRTKRFYGNDIDYYLHQCQGITHRLLRYVGER